MDEPYILGPSMFLQNNLNHQIYRYFLSLEIFTSQIYQYIL